jgi:ankyrin repeat protein
MRNDTASIRALLPKAAAADVNASQGDGMTALHWAARHGNLELTNSLLRARANTKAVTRIGAYTPLHVASEVGSGPVVAALVAAGADAKATSSTGVTALHLAAMSGSVAAVTALIDHGADVNAKEPAWQQTPLMLAAAQGRTDVAKLLVKRGANIAATAKVVDLVALAAADRVAKQRRNQVLATQRKAQGADNLPTWRPDSRTGATGCARRVRAGETGAGQRRARGTRRGRSCSGRNTTSHEWRRRRRGSRWIH